MRFFVLLNISFYIKIDLQCQISQIFINIQMFIYIHELLMDKFENNKYYLKYVHHQTRLMRSTVEVAVLGAMLQFLLLTGLELAELEALTVNGRALYIESCC